MKIVLFLDCDKNITFKINLPNIFLHLEIFKDIVMFESRRSEKENFGDREEREEEVQSETEEREEGAEAELE